MPLAIHKANGKLVPHTLDVEEVLPLVSTLHASAPQEAPATAAAEAPAATVVESEPLLDSTLHAPVLQDARVAIFASAEAQASIPKKIHRSDLTTMRPNKIWNIATHHPFFITSRASGRATSFKLIFRQ